MNTANAVVTRQSIHFKLMLSFALMVALLLGVMAAGWLTLDHVRAQAEKIAASDHVPQIKRLTDAEQMMLKLSLDARHAMLAVDDPPELQATLQRIGDNRQRLVALLDETEAHVTTERGRDIMRSIRQADADFWRLAQQTVGLIQAGDTAAAFALLKNELVPARNRQLEHIEAQIAWQQHLMNEELAGLSRTIVQVKMTLAVVVAVVLLLLGVFVVRLIGSITRRLAGLQDVIVRVEQSGDLTLHVGAAGQDEVGQAAAAFDRMMARIAALVGDTRQSAEAIAAAAHGMAAASSQVETGSGAQSEAAAAVAAAVEETSVSLSEAAGSAQTADQTAARARADIATTLAAVRETADEVDELAGMIATASGEISRLAESSRQIDGIVQTIKDIADQTNLLALNAAIEAARAGEQGRGFAVVADEVRKLAERTANSTREISTLIAGIQTEVDGAVARMQAANGKAGATRERVVASTGALDAASADTGRVTESVRGIAAAVREQEAAVQQVARRIEQIAQMTETNTAAARSAADAARHLNVLAGKLREAVGRFRV